MGRAAPKENSDEGVSEGGTFGRRAGGVDDHWPGPGASGVPGGGKAEVGSRKRRACEAVPCLAGYRAGWATSDFRLPPSHVASVVRDRLVGARASVAQVGLAEAAQDPYLQGCVDQDLAGEAGIRCEFLLAGETTAAVEDVDPRILDRQDQATTILGLE